MKLETIFVLVMTGIAVAILVVLEFKSRRSPAETTEPETAAQPAVVEEQGPRSSRWPRRKVSG